MEQNSRTRELSYIKKIAAVMDSKYRIPGTKFKFGLDPIIGLIPALGDAVAFVISGGLILMMVRNGASGKVAVKMTLNVLLDAIIGSIPVLGWIFDFFFKANNRNIRLLEEYYGQGKHKGSGAGILIAVAAALLVLFAAAIFAVVKLIQWATGLF